MTTNANLYALFRERFPQDLDDCWLEAIDGQQGSLYYSWRDLERGSAKIANLLSSLQLPAGSRIAAQVEKSAEALMLYLATIRAGFVYLPLNTAYRSDEMAYFIENASPAVVVCTPQNFGWVTQIAFSRGVSQVFTLDEPQAGNGGRNSGSLLARAAHFADTFDTVQRNANDLAASAAGYGLLNAKVRQRYQLGPGHVEVYAGVDNLLNRRYVGSLIVNQASAQFFEPGLPRNAMIGVKASLPL